MYMARKFSVYVIILSFEEHPLTCSALLFLIFMVFRGSEFSILSKIKFQFLESPPYDSSSKFHCFVVIGV